MKLVLSALALAALVGTARAADPAPPPPMVLMPQSLIDLARDFIRNPALPGAVDLWAGLTACEQANQAKPGAESGCPAVVQALEGSRKAAAGPAPPASAKP